MPSFFSRSESRVKVHCHHWVYPSAMIDPAVVLGKRPVEADTNDVMGQNAAKRACAPVLPSEHGGRVEVSPADDGGLAAKRSELEGCSCFDFERCLLSYSP